MNTRYRWMVATVATLAGAAPLAAQDAKPQALVITAQNLMAGDARHRELPDSTALLPGDVIQYRLLFTNVNDFAVQRVEFVDPIPAGLRYVAESARADREDVLIEFSIDGGTTYSTQPMIEVIEDGRPVKKPAPVERYTHVRWQVRGFVQPGAQVAAEFQARLPEARQPAEPTSAQ